MTRPTLFIALVALAILVIGVIVIAQDQGQAPIATTGSDGTTVEAPGTRVQSDRDGTRVQAPGVDITVPRDRDRDGG